MEQIMSGLHQLVAGLGKTERVYVLFAPTRKFPLQIILQKYKELAAELHPNKNGSLDATKIIGGGESLVVCKNGHSYQQTFSDRKRCHGCSKCFYESGRK